MQAKALTLAVASGARTVPRKTRACGEWVSSVHLGLSCWASFGLTFPLQAAVGRFMLLSSFEQQNIGFRRGAWSQGLLPASTAPAQTGEPGGTFQPAPGTESCRKLSSARCLQVFCGRGSCLSPAGNSPECRVWALL